RRRQLRRRRVRHHRSRTAGGFGARPWTAGGQGGVGREEKESKEQVVYFLRSLGWATMRRAMSPSSVVTKPTVTFSFTLSLPSMRVSTLIRNVRFSVLPSTLRDTVTFVVESSTIGPAKVSS